MRIMGIDFGTKKVGLALSDESGKMAFPHSVIPNNNDLLNTIVTLVQTERVSELVMGHSLDKEGKENAVHEAAVAFVGDLTLESPIPVHFEPEQYTSKQAEHLQGRNDQLDASAAALILQSYLDKQKTNSAFDELNK